MAVAASLTPPQAVQQQQQSKLYKLQLAAVTVVAVAVADAVVVFCGFHFFSHFHLLYLQF